MNIHTHVSHIQFTFTGDEALQKKLKKGTGTGTVDSSTPPNSNPTPLEVLGRFTKAKDNELPKLVWSLIDEVQGPYRTYFVRADLFNSIFWIYFSLIK